MTAADRPAAEGEAVLGEVLGVLNPQSDEERDYIADVVRLALDAAGVSALRADVLSWADRAAEYARERDALRTEADHAVCHADEDCIRSTAMAERDAARAEVAALRGRIEALAEHRPGGCCGKCPPIAGGGYDCTCEGNPRCDAERYRPAPVVPDHALNAVCLLDGCVAHGTATAPATPTSTDALRERVAAVLGEHQRWATHSCLCGKRIESDGSGPGRDAAHAQHQADAVLAVVGQGVTAEPLKVEWGVVLDDARSTDVYESREQAEAMAHYEGGVCEVVRIETWPHTPAVVRSGEQEGS